MRESYDTFQRRGKISQQQQQQLNSQFGRRPGGSHFGAKKKLGFFPFCGPEIPTSAQTSCPDTCSTSTAATWRACAVASSAESSSRPTIWTWSSAKRLKVNKSIFWLWDCGSVPTMGGLVKGSQKWFQMWSYRGKFGLFSIWLIIWPYHIRKRGTIHEQWFRGRGVRQWWKKCFELW